MACVRIGGAIVCGPREKKPKKPKEPKEAKPRLWPATGDEVKAAGYVSSGRGACRGCGCQMVWVTTPKGNSLPLTKTADGEKWEPHFASCPARDRFKRPK